MKTKTVLLAALVLVAVLASACGVVQTLTGRNAGTVSSLWSDVPPLPNSTKANINIPLPVQFIVQGFIQAANADSSSTTKLDKFDFVVYQTADSPQQVANFYTTDKMTAAGWNSQNSPGCSAGATGSGTAGVGFCAFGKKGDAGKETIVLILPAQDSQTQQTQVFYVRFEGTTKATTPAP